ncbi:hypothetical protein KKC91_03915 [bacterium]|nr:hypothetical protein [bacterium]
MLLKNYYPNIWGEGALFCLSGYDSNTDYLRPFIGRLLKNNIGVEIRCLKEKGSTRLVPSFAFYIDSKELSLKSFSKEKSVVSGDYIFLKFNNEKSLEITVIDNGLYFLNLRNINNFSIVWENNNKLIQNVIFTEDMTINSAKGKVPFSRTVEKCLAISLSYIFDNAHKTAGQFPLLKKKYKHIKRKSLSYYSKLKVPEKISSKHKATYAKSASVLRVNVESKQKKAHVRWTTPDKYPHRQMWIWDSVFHAIGWNYIDKQMAYEAIRAVLERMQKNGFIPMNMDSINERLVGETQAPIIGWGLAKIIDFGKCQKDQLEFIYEHLSRFIKWILENRSFTSSGLLGWLKIEDSTLCRCGESGWDNSPRFDHSGADDNIDLVTYMVGELSILAKLALILKKKKDKDFFDENKERLVKLINEKMWCEEDDLYYDLNGRGEFIKVKTPACFLPLLAKIPDERRAAILRDKLMDEKEFLTRMPIPSVSPVEKVFEKDMWRGPTWVNISYMIIEGLKNYGFVEDARIIAKRIVEEIDRWYQKIGVLMEYYDCEGKEDPRYMLRKGSRNKGARVIRDYGWTAALYIALVNEYL